jgi:hypothetical protein
MIELDFDVFSKKGDLASLLSPAQLKKALRYATQDTLRWLAVRVRKSEAFTGIRKPTVRFKQKGNRLWIGLNPVDSKYLTNNGLKGYALETDEFIIKEGKSKTGKRSGGVYRRNPSKNHKRGLIRTKVDVEDRAISAVYSFLNPAEDHFHKRFEHHLLRKNAE